MHPFTLTEEQLAHVSGGYRPYPGNEPTPVSSKVLEEGGDFPVCPTAPPLEEAARLTTLALGEEGGSAI